MIEKIILSGSFVTAVLAIIACLVKIYKFIRKCEKWIEDKDKHDRENYLSILRLTIMSEEMPLSERIAAGDKYIALGGNGEVKYKYNEIMNDLGRNEVLL